MPDLSVINCIVPHMAEVTPWFMPLLAIVLGGVFGSFLTCALYRVPRGISLWRPPSHCPRCENTLKAADLVPVGSWVWFRGQCRQCGTKIPFKYTLIEVLSILAALLSLWLAFGGGRFIFMYGGIMAFGAAIYLLFAHRVFAFKSVAFGLLCFVLYAAFAHPMFACGA